MDFSNALKGHIYIFILKLPYNIKTNVHYLNITIFVIPVWSFHKCLLLIGNWNFKNETKGEKRSKERSYSFIKNETSKYCAIHGII